MTTCIECRHIFIPLDIGRGRVELPEPYRCDDCLARIGPPMPDEMIRAKVREDNMRIINAEFAFRDELEARGLCRRCGDHVAIGEHGKDACGLLYQSDFSS